MKQVEAKAVVVALALFPLIASAQLTANLSVVSNYKTRGQDQDVRSGKIRPAIQGGIDYVHSSGMYVGNWNSTVRFEAGGDTARLESDFYAGYKATTGTVTWDIGAIRYQYPGARLANTTEAYLGVAWGPVGAKYYRTISDDYFNVAGANSGTGLSGRGTGYLNLTYSQEVLPQLTLKASVGYVMFRNEVPLPNYADYGFGLSYDIGGGFSFSTMLVGATRKGAYQGKENGGSVNADTLVLSISKSI